MQAIRANFPYFAMKLPRPVLLIVMLAAPFAGCVNVNEDTADSARDYWKPDASSQPPEPLALPAPKAGSGGEQAAQGPLGLPALVDIALENNPTTRQAWYQAKAAAAELGQTNSQFYPQITVNATVSRDKLRNVAFNGQTLGAGTTWSTFYGPSVEINYLLWNWGKNYAQSDRGAADFVRGELRLQPADPGRDSFDGAGVILISTPGWVSWTRPRRR